MRAAACLILALLVAGHAAAISIKWTGYANNNQWDTPTNWYPDSVPGINDDVTIASGVVIAPSPVAVNSLMMGTAFDSPANLTIFSSFLVSQAATVDGNGNLFINSGAAAASGTFNIAGNLYFGSGSLSGIWTVSNRASAFLNSAALKAFTGCQFNVQGTVMFSGILALNQSSVITVTSAATASGNFAIQSQDNTAVLFDTSAGSFTYLGGGDFQIQAPVKIGTFTLAAGNLTIFDTVNFVNSFAIPNGSFVATVGNANVNMTAGVTGAGVLTAEGNSLNIGNLNMTGDLNIGGGVVTFSSEQNNVALLTIFGGTTLMNNGCTAGMLNLLSGVLNGPSGIVALKAYVNTPGFNLNAPVHFGGSVAVMGKSILAFGAAGRLTFGAKATVSVSGSLQFTGAPGSPGVINNGVFNVVGPVAFQNVNLAGTGTINIGSTLTVNSITFAQTSIALGANGSFKGANTLITNIGKVYGNPMVWARFGSYQLNCPGSCNNVNTNGVPTSTFRFAGASGVFKH